MQPGADHQECPQYDQPNSPSRHSATPLHLE
jgi:hypothetical protein